MVNIFFSKIFQEDHLLHIKEIMEKQIMNSVFDLCAFCIVCRQNEHQNTMYEFRVMHFKMKSIFEDQIVQYNGPSISHWALWNSSNWVHKNRNREVIWKVDWSKITGIYLCLVNRQECLDDSGATFWFIQKENCKCLCQLEYIILLFEKINKLAAVSIDGTSAVKCLPPDL